MKWIQLLTFECPLQSQSSVKKGHLKEEEKECEENREEIKDFLFQEDENKLGVEKVVEEKEGQPLHCPP